MALQKYNLLGKTFGKWVVVDKTHVKYGNRNYLKWICVCGCGNEGIISSYRLRNGLSTQCRKCSDIDRLGNTYGQLPKGEASFNALYTNYKFSAQYRDLVFKLNKNDFRKLTKERCFYCNAEPSQVHNPNGVYNGYYIYNGIDRKNNNKGYTIDNCVSCCKVCNYMKSSMDFDEFINRVKVIYHNVESIA